MIAAPPADDKLRVGYIEQSRSPEGTAQAHVQQQNQQMRIPLVALRARKCSLSPNRLNASRCKQVRGCARAISFYLLHSDKSVPLPEPVNLPVPDVRSNSSIPES